MPTPERTSYAEIVAAGRDILEESGPAGLTMQSVAQRVGVRAPSLYKRVRDRDALIGAVAAATVDDLTGRLEASDRSLEGLARAYRALAHERPEGFRLMFAAAAPQELLDRAGLTIVDSAAVITGEEHALDAARLVTAWATGFIHMELAGAFRLGGDVDGAFDYGLAALRRGLGS
ncbi:MULTISPECIES: TetR/AcrR family transcriptional regulator [Microbacterium]|jgi:AcrR family transcriptional regulator|uniref:Bacterial regulatory protein, tetR family n=1 Tax=Microbacterium trichothecenolyticum TaxID=69370 RepID=A0A0M2HBH9_MICTR|nr:MULTISPECIES: TetR/AcrR family transcriptional regulator [Microbacterium]KJL41438.1 Bacterial regulatory protein, tetR family [Microbacterium trichothecenolyticum]MDR7190513.1 AcrR family transcriptional regulator [Microbacterium sp. BE35]